MYEGEKLPATYPGNQERFIFQETADIPYPAVKQKVRFIPLGMLLWERCINGR